MEQQQISVKERLSVAPAAHAVIPMRSVLVFLIATLSTAVVLELASPDCKFWNTVPFRILSQNNKSVHANSSPKFAIYQRSASEEHLRHVLQLLDLFGYERTSLEGKWDLLWAHDYPFLRMPKRMKELESHQVVNHIPGCGFLTNKVDLSTTLLPFLPRAFRLPEQQQTFLQYSSEHPDAVFVEKHNEHRHIFIRSPEKINLSSSDSFVQEFVKNPFLVDGYKFDIGVYTVITSVDPLLLYIYTGDVLFRYCATQYHPFDASDVSKYIVGDDYLPTWKVPSLAKYYSHFGGSMRAAFDAYVRSQSKDPSKIWFQVEEIIRQTVLAKQQDIARVLSLYKTGTFFDLLRFDLIIDDQLQVHLMEANMSPNLSSAHFKPNALLYEQILYSVLNLVGIGTPLKQQSVIERSSKDENIVTAEKNLAVNLNLCAENECTKFCNRAECALCLPCLSGSEYGILEKAHREHLHKIDMKRIFPTPIFTPENFDIEFEVQNMTKRNAWLSRWFLGKCQYERSWCN